MGEVTTRLLTALLGKTEICVITIEESPAQKQPEARVRRDDAVFTLVDEQSGRRYEYDLSSAVDEGYDTAAFSVTVSPHFTVEADCLLGRGGVPTAEKFRSGDAVGVRFQPFYLSMCAVDPKELIGRGLFFRGLHFAGTVTPGNVSQLAVCDSCRGSFRLQSFHCGFSDQAYFYCSGGPHTLVISSWEDGAPPALGQADVVALAELERRLPECEICGGNFAFKNGFRCPHCGEPYIDFAKHPDERATEYYGVYLYGQKPQKWASEQGA